MWADNGSPLGSPRLDGDPGPTSRISRPTVPDRPPDRHPGLRRENSITLSDGMSERTSAISADRRANRVWKLRRMAVPEWDVLCRVGPGHWLGAGLPLAPEKNSRASGQNSLSVPSGGASTQRRSGSRTPRMAIPIVCVIDPSKQVLRGRRPRPAAAACGPVQARPRCARPRSGTLPPAAT